LTEVRRIPGRKLRAATASLPNWNQALRAIPAVTNPAEMPGTPNLAIAKPVQSAGANTSAILQAFAIFSPKPFRKQLQNRRGLSQFFRVREENGTVPLSDAVWKLLLVLQQDFHALATIRCGCQGWLVHKLLCKQCRSLAVELALFDILKDAPFGPSCGC
jgi:hypothetical protein